MPTRKQRRRAAKERRHEYETVWVDEEGNELDEPPEDAAVATRERREDGRPKGKAKAQPQRGGRATREPPVPSWSRAAKRSAILGVAVFAFFYLVGSKGSANRLPSALGVAALYCVLFIPFTYYIDRMTRGRWEKRQGTKKR
jgi:hypothetical protein